MSRIAYVDGVYAPIGAASVNVEDRGLQFADAVYEVWAVLDGRLADAAGHFDRLARSLRELRIAAPMSRAALTLVLRETVRRNRVRHALLYLQVTRGTARRDHGFPDPAVRSTLIVTCRPLDLEAAEAKAAAGVAVVTGADQRWARCDIKSTSLLPNVLAKQAAREAGAYEAWLVDGGGRVTEGASTNAWIVDQEGRLRTRATRDNILRGVTRTGVRALAAELRLSVNETPFTVEEAQRAREAFITAASTFVMPVVRINGVAIGNGRPGPVAKRLRTLYLQAARAGAI